MWDRKLQACLFLVSCAGTLPAQKVPCPAASHIVIGDGTFSSQAGVTFRLRHFAAALQPLGRTAPSCYEKMTVLTHGEIFVSDGSLTRLFAEKLDASQSKIQDFKIANRLGSVALSGKITKIVPIQFSIEGPVTTDGTSLLINVSKIKADGIPVKALLALVGEHLSAVLSMKGVSGVSVNENVLVFSPERIAHLKGHIASVETTAGGLVLRYGGLPTPTGVHKREMSK